MTAITWFEKTDNNRIVARCGAAAVGAVFSPYESQRRVRVRWHWRAFISQNMNPIEGSEKTQEEAMRQVERRFDEFLALAKLQPIPEPLPSFDGPIASDHESRI